MAGRRALTRRAQAQAQTASPERRRLGSSRTRSSLLDIGTRRIEVSKLDAQGKPISSALVVTAPGARPMSFELAAAADGSAYIGFRGDDTTPGAAGGALQLVHVKLDGSFEKLELSGESNGTGTPSFLRDESANGRALADRGRREWRDFLRPRGSSAARSPGTALCAAVI